MDIEIIKLWLGIATLPAVFMVAIFNWYVLKQTNRNRESIDANTQDIHEIKASVKKQVDDFLQLVEKKVVK